jgi:hypothetical protein
MNRSFTIRKVMYMLLAAILLVCLPLKASAEVSIGPASGFTKLASGTNGAPPLANDDRFGSVVARIGDLNSDGVEDLAIGAPFDNTGGFLKGAVYVAFMNIDGTIQSTIKLAHNTNGCPTLLDDGEFGSAMAGIGDLDQDGVPDLAIGAPNDSTGGTSRGAVYIAFMNRNGTIRETIKLASGLNGGPALTNGDNFGWSVAKIGDLNHDGVVDFAIGAPDDNTGGSGRGAVYIAFMKTDGTIRNAVKLASSTNGGPILTDEDHFGWSVTGINDLDHDGIPDLAIGTPYDDTGGINRGAVYVAFMKAVGNMRSTIKLASDTNGFPALADEDWFGFGMSIIGDLDRDGVEDLAISSERANTGGAGWGEVYIVFMKTDGSARSIVKLVSGTAIGAELADIQSFGYAVAEIGDLNRDGVIDLAVGAPFDDTGGTDRGAVFLLNLTGPSLLPNPVSKGNMKLASSINGGPALANGDQFGWSVAKIGDLDRDGVEDIAIGTPYDDTGGTWQGAVYVSFMKVDGTIRETVKLASGINGGPPLAESDNFGWSVAGIGDLDRDGIPDLAIGAPYDSSVSDSRGALYLSFMKVDGTISETVKIASGINGGPVLADGDLFGYSVTRIDDLNRDGVEDLAIGAPFDSFNGLLRGAVYVAFMKADGTISNTVKLADNTNGGPALADEDCFGAAVSGIGDLDRDGIPDLAIGAPYDDTGGNNRGAVYISFMKVDGTIRELVKLANSTNGVPALMDEDAFGSSLAEIGDLNRDGIVDLALGAPYDDTGGSAYSDKGAVYLAFMQTDGKIQSMVKLASGINGGPALANEDNFGWSVAGIGDLDRNGIGDIATGVPYDKTGGTARGAVYISFLQGRWIIHLPMIMMQ